MQDTQTTRRRVWTEWVANLGLLTLLVALALPLLHAGGEIWKWIYAGGALVLLAGRLLQDKKMPTLRATRLKRLEVWAAIVFCVGAGFTFYNGARPTEWLAFFLAGGVIQAYASIMMPLALKKKDR